MLAVHLDDENCQAAAKLESMQSATRCCDLARVYPRLSVRDKKMGNGKKSCLVDGDANVLIIRNAQYTRKGNLTVSIISFRIVHTYSL